MTGKNALTFRVQMSTIQRYFLQQCLALFNARGYKNCWPTLEAKHRFNYSTTRGILYCAAFPFPHGHSQRRRTQLPANLIGLRWMRVITSGPSSSQALRNPPCGRPRIPFLCYMKISLRIALIASTRNCNSKTVVFSLLYS